jgi:hypothetical protein
MVTRSNRGGRTGKAKRPANRVQETVWDRIAKLGEEIPPEERARFPKDGARNLHHYLHGAPKRD